MILSASEIEKYCFCQGRRYVEDGRLFLNPSGASLKGLFRGECLKIALRGDPAQEGRNTYIRLTFDGRSRRIRLPLKEKVIALSAPMGEHLFEIVKLSESQSNALSVSSVVTDGDFLPYREQKPLKIEFVGDSITTGFGVRAKRADEEYTTATQDVTLSYAYLTARALNAEMHVVAASGWGVYKSKYAEQAIPDYYGNVDLTRNAAPWDFSLFRPDLIVVALGTNDFSYLGDLSPEKRAEEKAALKKTYVAFLRSLLRQDAKVILCYGFSGSEAQAELPALAHEIWRDIDSPDFYTLQVKDAHSLSDIRAGHPGRKTHRLAAKKLVACIKSILSSS